MQPLVSLCALSRVFRQKSGIFGATRLLQAVRDVNLELFPGRTLGVVGESGSGKSTLGRMAAGLLPPSSGEVRILGEPLYGPRGAVRRPSGGVQMIFQDPYSSFNPRMRVGKAVEEPLLWTGKPLALQERRQRVEAALAQVGLDSRQAGRYPHEFSGGQRQRLAIARALITQPAFLVCDEPTSSLDASIQAQVLNLLKDMQDSLGPAYLFISHDLSVVRHMADRVAVLYQGLVLEEAETDELFRHPLHPYTRLLISPEAGREAAFAARNHPAQEVRDLCPFLELCPEALPRCRSEPVALSGKEHAARCLRVCP